MRLRLSRIFHSRAHHFLQSKIVRMIGYAAAYLIPSAVIYQVTGSMFFSLGLLLLIFCLGQTNYGRVASMTYKRDFWALYCLIKFRLYMRRNIRRNRTVPIIFEDIATQYPRKIALQWENVKWTFHELDQYSNSVANYFYKKGLRRGDNVAVFVSSRPEFVAIWLGLSKIGVVSALINFNLRDDALAHCVNIAKARAVITSGNLVDAIETVRTRLQGEMEFYTICESSESLSSEKSAIMDGAICLDRVLKEGNCNRPTQPKDADYFDRLTYIYTSGTTGLPKAAVITHNRFIYMCTMPHYILKYKKDDVFYCALPLYHSNGGIVGLGQCLIHGLTFSFRSKFSASNFWSDCIKYNASVILYIGEICRYLLAQPHKETDKQHKVRVASGNGLRMEIWDEFVNRFNIKEVGEFYGATEGNANLISVDSKRGSCGFVSRMAPFAYPIRLMRVDSDSEFIRGPDGLCVKCKPGEQGMVIGKIIQGSATQGYVGYADESASQKKVVSDVLVKGDQYFVSGDILEMDELGYMYFRDRTGDTFRWKGENVSTAECEARIAAIFDRQLTIAVYGVNVPHADGKAGMACIEDIDQKMVDIEQLYKQLENALPSYARPLFIRLTKEIEVTSTHKVKKVNLAKDGYDLEKVSDPMFFYDGSKKIYVPLTAEIIHMIQDGTARV